MGNGGTYIRSGGRKRNITRMKEGQEIDYGIYATNGEARRAHNSSVNRVHVNKSRCT